MTGVVIVLACPAGVIVILLMLGGGRRCSCGARATYGCHCEKCLRRTRMELSR